MQFGLKAANFPLIPEDFDRGRLPGTLEKHRSKLFGLTIQPERLHQIREERRMAGSKYASLANCRFEIAEAEKMMRREGIRWLDSSTKSIEEISTTVLQEAGLLSACVTTGTDPNNPSPTSGGDTSATANAMADKGMYKPVEYTNAKKKGPPIVVIPGEIKSNNASFTQKFASNNIADFGELELSQANFKVLERSDLGPLLGEFQLAYSMGDPDSARKLLQKGKFKTTKYVVKFDILKAEQVAAGAAGLSAASAIGNDHRHSRCGQSWQVQQPASRSGRSKTEECGYWCLDHRHALQDHRCQHHGAGRATGYAEEKMELGAKSTSVLGVSSGASGGLTLDSLVQRLVQKTVYEIDLKNK
jgi:hypothetical protein